MPEEQVNIAKRAETFQQPKGSGLKSFQRKKEEGRRGPSVRKDWVSDYLGFIPALPGPGRSGICALCRVPGMREKGSLVAQGGSVLPENGTLGRLLSAFCSLLGREKGMGRDEAGSTLCSWETGLTSQEVRGGQVSDPLATQTVSHPLSSTELLLSLGWQFDSVILGCLILPNRKHCA